MCTSANSGGYSIRMTLGRARLSLLPQLFDNCVAQPEVDERDKTDNCETRRDNEPLEAMKELALATPIQECWGKGNTNSLQGGDY